MTHPHTIPPIHHDLTYESSISTINSGHLITLAACWYVAAGLAFLLGSGFGIFYGSMGLWLVTGPGVTEPNVALTGKIFIALGISAILLSTLIAYLRFLVARSLQKRKRLPLIYIMAALICLSIPLGTILGIFTFLVLNRPSVKSSFAK